MAEPVTQKMGPSERDNAKNFWDISGYDEEFYKLASIARLYHLDMNRICSHENWSLAIRPRQNLASGFSEVQERLLIEHNDPHIMAAVIDFLQRDGALHSLDPDTAAKFSFLRKLRDAMLTPPDSTTEFSSRGIPILMQSRVH